MVKKLLQDVLPPDKRSIRHIPLPKDREVEKSPPPEIPKRRSRSGKSMLSRWGIVVFSLLLLVGAVLGASWLFASATVVVTPKQATASLDMSLELGPGANMLPQAQVMATSTTSTVIASSKFDTVERKASGQITIFNNYSNDPQRLIKNTRFQAADGRIYRISNSVIVPGQQIENGKKTPGSITTLVYADAAGPDYNMTLSDLKGDFTVPGFKGTPRYETFFARLKTDITGGFSGKERVPDATTLNNAVNQLKANLSEELWKQLQTAVPASYATSRNLYSTDFQASTADNPSGEGIVVQVIGTGRAFLLDRSAASKLIASRTLPGYNQEDVLIENFDDINFSPRAGTPSSDTGVVVLSVKGNAHFVWQFDESKVVAELSGRSKADTNSIMRDYPAIEKAEVTIKPSWLTHYPSQSSKVHLIIDLGQKGSGN